MESGVRHPQRIRAADLELPIHPVIRALALHYRARGLRPPAPPRTLQPQPAHPPRHPPMGLGGRRATRHRDPFTAKLAPDLAHPVHREVLVVHPADLPAQPLIAAHPPRRALRLPFARLVLVVRRWSARHLGACHPRESGDRPDPVSTPMSVDERHHHLARRSCSAWANGGGVVCMTPNESRVISVSYETHRISLGLGLVPARKPHRQHFSHASRSSAPNIVQAKVEVTALGQRHVQVLLDPRRGRPESRPRSCRRPRSGPRRARNP